MTRDLPKTPQHDDLRGHLLELYARLNAAIAPPDQVIARYFRLRPALPNAARGFLAATVYALLRNRIRTLLLWQWAGRSEPRFAWEVPSAIPPVLTPVEEAALALARWMTDDLQAEPAEARSLVDAAIAKFRTRPLPEGEFPPPETGQPEKCTASFLQAFPAGAQLAQAPSDVRRCARLSMPADILARWTERFGYDAASALAHASREPAPLDLRVNRIKGSRDEAAALLAREGLEAAPASYSPDALRLSSKTNVFRTQAFREGWFEVQDEASQLVGFALDPKPTWRVLDACSGGGGKSLHLAALMMNRGEVYVHDIDAGRLEPQRKRLRRAGLHNVRFLEPGMAASAAPYDAVLIDAPCLGFGTLRRNPDLAWRSPLGGRLEEIAALQRECLRAYAPLVRPDGILVYATCSFEPEETDAVLAGLEGFAPDSLQRPLGRHGLEQLASGGAHTLLMLPSIHGTDGFFVARLRRLG